MVGRFSRSRCCSTISYFECYAGPCVGWVVTCFKSTFGGLSVGRNNCMGSGSSTNKRACGNVDHGCGPA